MKRRLITLASFALLAALLAGTLSYLGSQNRNENSVVGMASERTRRRRT